MLYGGSSTPVTNPQNANTGGTIIENHWSKISVENSGSSTTDVIGYPSDLTGATVTIYGFTSLEENGTELATASSGNPIPETDISQYPYIKIYVKKTISSGASVSAIGIKLYD